jgi:hypothetical protein
MHVFPRLRVAWVVLGSLATLAVAVGSISVLFWCVLMLLVGAALVLTAVGEQRFGSGSGGSVAGGRDNGPSGGSVMPP